MTPSDIVEIAAAAGDLLRDRFGDPGLVSAKGDLGHEGRVFDVVTELDHACEALIIDRIARISPDAYVVAEERGVVRASQPESGPRLPYEHDALAQVEDLWIVDPLDGTLNYSQSLPLFAVSIARYRFGVPVAGVVHAPMLNESWTFTEDGGARLNGDPISVHPAASAHETLLAAGGAGRATRGVGLQFRSWRRVGSAALSLAWVAGGRFGAYVQLGELQPWDVAAGVPIVRAAGGHVTDHHLQPWTNPLATSTGIVAAPPGIHDEVSRTIAAARAGT